VLLVLKKNKKNPHSQQNQTPNLLKSPFEGLHIKAKYIDQSQMQFLHHNDFFLNFLSSFNFV